MALSYKCKKSDLKLKLTGKLEIQYDEKNTDIREFNIEAADLNRLVHKLLDEFNKTSIAKVEEILLFISEKRGETY